MGATRRCLVLTLTLTLTLTRCNEAVQLLFDPRQTSYEALCEVLWGRIDPTLRNQVRLHLGRRGRGPHKGKPECSRFIFVDAPRPGGPRSRRHLPPRPVRTHRGAARDSDGLARGAAASARTRYGVDERAGGGALLRGRAEAPAIPRARHEGYAAVGDQGMHRHDPLLWRRRLVVIPA
eukprot:scaffold82326_cov63-Phaeocystis_antarctica.AAC.2